jgi:hypothetical protein
MTNFILFITFLAIIWYSIETRRLVAITKKKMRIDIEPLVVVEDVSGGQIKIKNIGNNAALNIKILTISKRKCRDCKYTYDIDFAEYPIIEHGAEQKIIGLFKICESSGLQNPNADPFLNFNNHNFIDDYQIAIHCTDIEQGRWETKALIDKNGIHFQGIRELKD